MTQTFSWQRAVLKVGSALIAPEGSHCSARYLLAIAHFITASRAAGKEIIIVSSGSVAAGKPHVPVTHRPTIAEKQAMAAIGQMQMMANWQRFFDVPCAQVLVTAADLQHRQRYVNIQATLRELLAHGALPVVNENDTVAVDELKVGDNDNLAAHTAMVAQADTMIICSDIDGLFTADPRRHADATLIETVSHIDDDVYALAGGPGSAVGTGGMQTKLQAAQKCMDCGIQSLIVNGKNPAVFEQLLTGQVKGTRFIPARSPARARYAWLTHTLKTRGTLHIDTGACQALTDRQTSLLPAGVVAVTGSFGIGDAVVIQCNGVTIAKGLAQYDSKDLLTIKGLHSCQITSALGYYQGDEVVHRDNLVRLSDPHQAT